ncbi:MAG TPA: DUF6163 family protein [Enterovirga sp.]|jgi:hypothetical protein
MMIGLPRSRHSLALAAPRDDDQLHAEADAPVLRWNMILVTFMRVVSVIWLGKGLLAWALILGIGYEGAFEGRSTGFQAAMIYFAVMDLVAAIGLWLTSTWGGVLWLLAVMSHLILAVFFPRFVSNGSLLIALFIVLIMSYLTVSWLAAVDE